MNITGLLRRSAVAIALIAQLVTLPGVAFAQQPFAGRLDEFWSGHPPEMVGTGMADALCASHFATLYSEATETPFYSAEHLTPAEIEAAVHLRRVNEFHQDTRLPRDVASTLEDYRGSGFDRGHMALNVDMPDARSQWQSFALCRHRSC